MVVHGRLSALLACLFLANSGAGEDLNSVTVSPDGAGAQRTVAAAVGMVPDDNPAVFTIHVKPGVYLEHLVIPKNKPRVRLVGENAETTVLTFNLHANLPGPDRRPLGTFRTASTVVYADNFEAENITFANSTPRDISQAL